MWHKWDHDVQGMLGHDKIHTHLLNVYIKVTVSVTKMNKYEQILVQMVALY